MIWKRSGADCIFSAVLLICIEWGLFRCLYAVTGFDDAKIIFQELIALLVPFAVLCSFLFSSRRSVSIGIPVMILFLSFFVGIYRDSLLVWLKYTVSSAVLAVNDYYGVSLKAPVSLNSIPVENFREGNMVVCFLAAFLLSLDVAGFQKAVRIGVLSSCIVIFGMCVGKIPSGLDLLFLFTGFLGLAAMGKRTSDFHKRWKCGKKTVIEITCEEQEEEKETFFHGGQMASAVTLFCFLVALCFGSFFGKQTGSDLLELHAPVQNQINALEYQLLHYDYSRFLEEISKHIYLGNIEWNQDQGKLTNHKVTHTGTEILQITLEKKPMEAIYLRGFIGKDYNGDSWTQAEESDFASQVKEWKLENQENTELAIQNFAFAKISSRFDSPTKIKIDYSSHAGTYAYLPYLSKAGGSLTISGDGAVFRTAGKKNTLVETLYTTGFCKYALSYYQNVTAKEEDSAEKTALEEQYRQYVQKEYLSVPKNLKKLKRECRKNIHTQNLYTTTTTIQEYIQSNAVYSLELDPLPMGEDFTEYFLYTQKKGYCIHFATAAVLMYRICRIPSRFVEGYVVWPKDFVENSDGTYTAAVTDERAHAWAEIYYDGFGFMPVDMTPGDAADYTVENTAGEEKDRDESRSLEEADGQTENQKDEEQETGAKAEEELPETEDETGNETENKTFEETEGETKDEAENGAKDEAEAETQAGTEEATGEAAEAENSTETGGSQTKGTQEASNDAANAAASGESVSVWNPGTAARTALCLLTAFVLLTSGQLVFYKKRYEKEWKRQSRGFQDKRRKEVIKLSCKLYASMEISGYEKKWRKNCKGSLTDREYEVMIRKEFSFLNDEYEEFRKLVQKARFASPEAENIISETELMQCREVVKVILAALVKKAGWYKKLLLRMLFTVK